MHLLPVSTMARPCAIVRVHPLADASCRGSQLTKLLSSKMYSSIHVDGSQAIPVLEPHSAFKSHSVHPPHLNTPASVHETQALPPARHKLHAAPDNLDSSPCFPRMRTCLNHPATKPRVDHPHEDHSRALTPPGSQTTQALKPPRFSGHPGSQATRLSAARCLCSLYQYAQ